MIDAIIGGTITFFAVLGTAYVCHKISRKMHWSEGYVVLGKDYQTRNKKEEQQPTGTSTSDSMFPPGWG